MAPGVVRGRSKLVQQPSWEFLADVISSSLRSGILEASRCSPYKVTWHRHCRRRGRRVVNAMSISQMSNQRRVVARKPPPAFGSVAIVLSHRLDHPVFFAEDAVHDQADLLPLPTHDHQVVSSDSYRRREAVPAGMCSSSPRDDATGARPCILHRGCPCGADDLHDRLQRRGNTSLSTSTIRLGRMARVRELDGDRRAWRPLSRSIEPLRSRSWT